MKIEGHYFFKNGNWIGKIDLLDVLEISTQSSEDLFIRIKFHLASIFAHSKKTINETDFFIEVIDEVRFFVKFKNMKLAASTIFKSIRNKEKISQIKLASKLNCATSSYSQYEETKKEPTLSKFSEVLECMGYEWLLVLKKQ